MYTREDTLTVPSVLVEAIVACDRAVWSARDLMQKNGMSQPDGATPFRGGYLCVRSSVGGILDCLFRFGEVPGQNAERLAMLAKRETVRMFARPECTSSRELEPAEDSELVATIRYGSCIWSFAGFPREYCEAVVVCAVILRNTTAPQARPTALSPFSGNGLIMPLFDEVTTPFPE